MQDIYPNNWWDVHRWFYWMLIDHDLLVFAPGRGEQEDEDNPLRIVVDEEDVNGTPVPVVDADVVAIDDTGDELNELDGGGKVEVSLFAPPNRKEVIHNPEPNMQPNQHNGSVVNNINNSADDMQELYRVSWASGGAVELVKMVPDRKGGEERDKWSRIIRMCGIARCQYKGISTNMKKHKAAKHGANVVWLSCDQENCDFKAKQAYL